MAGSRATIILPTTFIVQIPWHIIPVQLLVWIDTPDFHYEPVSGTLTITNSSDDDTGSYSMTVSGIFSKHDESLRDTYIGDVVISGTANVVQVP